MNFVRQKSDKWHHEVPGARWFKADLHIHTIDDHPGGKVKWPEGINGDPNDPAILDAYARCFLQAAVVNGVQVLGLTPHSPRAGNAPETSAVWRIVDMWNTGMDDDGIPFREKVYAIFPGFEPSLKEGRKGLHLLFLFDPEIGRDRYLRLFDVLMGGASPWENNHLRVSSHTAGECFNQLATFLEREGGIVRERMNWRYLVLAPHIDTETGLLGAQKGEILQLFQHDEVRGLELGDHKLPSDTAKDRPWLKKGMEEHRQGFYHSSDACKPKHIGRRHVWLKLANPTIEALRQAFIANESRIRIGLQRGRDGALQALAEPPDITVHKRPWLRSITVRGGAAFFGGAEADDGAARFELSPDLTCIIGGSMTGKSTLLDGLRMYVGAEPPDNATLREQVEERGRNRFLAGSPHVELDCPGGDVSGSLHEQWPAVFYTQNELQRLADEPASVEDILARLDPIETMGIKNREQQLDQLDDRAKAHARRLAELEEQLSEAQQALERAKQAKEELAAFSEAGVERLHAASRSRRQWQEAKDEGNDLAGKIEALIGETEGCQQPTLNADLEEMLQQHGISVEVPDSRWKRVRQYLDQAHNELSAWRGETNSILQCLKAREQLLQTEVERALAERGYDASRIQEFQSLSRQASLLESYQDHLDKVEGQRNRVLREFSRDLEERDQVAEEQRQAYDRVIDRIIQDFEGRIRPRRIEHGQYEPLKNFLAGKQKGITQWWNGLGNEEKPSPQRLSQCLEKDRLDELGMSATVQDTFREYMDRAKRWAMAALRCRDRYVLEHRVEDGPGEYRRLEDLSGGRRVSVLLSLLLKTVDERPLVIDQPEDQLDNRFLFEEVLPALKGLKGRRQIIVATHNANIVVNGDADQVIQLEATGSHGRIACAGAIEEPRVRDAIVHTVDGGDEAFRLRRLKYGF